LPFNNTWTYIQNNLQMGSKIRYWSSQKGWTTGDFEIVSITQNDIKIEILNGSLHNIPQNEFIFVYQKWASLWDRTIQRQSLKQKSRNASYIISIYFWMHCEIGSKLP